MKPKPRSKSPVNAPRQTRSTRTQEKILAVVEKHLRAGTFDRVSVQDVVTEAGCSVGAFYGRFANKAAAVYYFYDVRCTSLEKNVEAVLDPKRPEPLADLLAEFTRTVVRRTFDYAAIIRSDALRIASGPANPFTRRARDLNARLQRALQRCLHARSDECSVTASDETALFVLALVGGLSRDAVVNGGRLVESAGTFGAERFTRELTLAVTRYLGVRPPE